MPLARKKSRQRRTAAKPSKAAEATRARRARAKSAKVIVPVAWHASARFVRIRPYRVPTTEELLGHAPPSSP
jgi:hypothetical protein